MPVESKPNSLYSYIDCTQVAWHVDVALIFEKSPKLLGMTRKLIKFSVVI